MSTLTIDHLISPILQWYRDREDSVRYTVCLPVALLLILLLAVSMLEAVLRTVFYRP